MKRIYTFLFIALNGYMSAQLAVSITNVAHPCNNDGSATAVATGGTPPYQYTWYATPNAPSFTDPLVATTSVLGNAAPGNYSCAVKDASGAFASSTVSLNPPFTITPATTSPGCLASNGSFTCTVNGGTAPYTYEWSTGQVFTNQSQNTTTISSLKSGYYSLNVTDGNGCTFGFADAALSASSTLWVTISTSPSYCANGSAHAVVTGGTPPYSYFWETIPPRTTPTIYGLDSGYVSVSVTDANGCNVMNLANLVYAGNGVKVGAATTPAVCPNANGTIDVTVTGGTAPYTYNWSNGATTQDLSGLAAGAYSLTVTDNGGCQITRQWTIPHAGPVIPSVTTTPATCFNNDGSATATATGGTPPYTYHWNNGQSGSTITHLSEGLYGVTITDANGCSHAYPMGQSNAGFVTAPFACKGSFSGEVFNDRNGNCVRDAGEAGIVGQIVDLGNGQYASTNAFNGASYSVSVWSPATYSIDHTPPAGWSAVCPSSGYTVSVAPGQSVAAGDFYQQANGSQHDLRVYVNTGDARSGASYTKYITVYNNGAFTETGILNITYDTNEVFEHYPSNSGRILHYDSVARTLSIELYSVRPYETIYFLPVFHIPSSVSPGTPITTSVSITPTSTDAAPADNQCTVSNAVAAAFAPNRKEVNPQGAGPAGLIAPNIEMEYNIYFQNLSPFCEIFIIKDTLDPDLDITSFEFTGACTFPYWEISGSGVLTATITPTNSVSFSDSIVNDPYSRGYISYHIKQKPNLPGGTEIRNRAWISMGQGQFLPTNSTLNTIQVVGLKEYDKDRHFTISPNPAQDQISIKCDNKNEVCKKAEILDMNGRIVASVVANGPVIALPELANGVYIVSAHFNSGIYKEKLIISK